MFLPKKSRLAVTDLTQLTQSPGFVRLPSRSYRTDYRSDSELAEVGSCVGHPLLMMEVERKECRTESERDAYPGSRDEGVVPSPNRVEVE